MAFLSRPEFKEDLHPRGRPGSGAGGRFVAKPHLPAVAKRRGPPPAAAAPVKAAKAVKAVTPPVPQPKAKRAAKRVPAKPIRFDAATAVPKLRAAIKGKKKPAGFSSPPRAAKPAMRAVTPDDARNKMLDLGRKPDGSIDFAERAKYADRVLTEWFESGFDTQSLYRDKKTGEWTPERQAQQEQLIEDIWYAHAANVPNQGRAIFSGGLGGAGKGYALGKVHRVDTDADWEHPGQQHEFFTINPDTVKAMMAQRGMIPLDVDPNLTPMELSPLAHEEASMIADRLADRAYIERKNLVWDFTMGSEKSVIGKRLDPMRAAGYDQVTAMFVDTTVERSVEQATKRWQRGMTDFIGGKGDGGRFLPSKATDANRPVGGEFRSKNREVFEATKDHFDGYVLMENLNGDMRQVEQHGAALGGKGQKRRALKSDTLDVDAMSENVGNHFTVAPDWMKDTGPDWYPGGQEWIGFAVEGTDLTPEQGAAIVAAMSPNTPWDRNLVLALNFIKGRPLGEDDGAGTLTDNVDRANRVKNMVDIDGNPIKDPIKALPGKDKEGAYKISNFYRNLTGNQEAVTIDRWAIRAATGADDATAKNMLGQKGTYAKVADAYRKAAAKAGVTPAAMQAIVWGQVRGSFE